MDMKPQDRERICVLGTGAIGSSVAADLTAAGHDVTMIDYWPAHIEAIRSEGLRINLPDRELHVTPPAIHLCDVASSNLALDVVLLASKSNDHRWLAEFIKPSLKPDGFIAGLQNGMNDDSIAEIIGRERVIGCVVELSAELFTPGIVRRNTPPEKTWFAVGELDGKESKRANRLAELLRSVGKVEISANIYGAKWSKLIANTMTMGPFGLLGLYNHEAPNLPGMFEISVRLGLESLKVGEALGYRIEPLFGLRPEDFAGSDEEKIILAMRTLLGHVSRGRTAPIHDHLKGRHSEIRFISGVVSEQGRKLGIATPVNDAVVEIDWQINEGLRSMEPSNFELLKEMIDPPSRPTNY